MVLHVELPLVLHHKRFECFRVELGQILGFHSRYALLKLVEVIYLLARWRLKFRQIAFEGFIVRKEHLGELLE